jgi:hypothetical protein
LGGFVVVQVFAPPKPPTDGAGTAQAAATTKAEPKAPAETTGSAPSGESVASAGCDQQTWPNLTRDCMEEYRNKNRGPRVVSTDRLDKPSVEVSQPAPADEFKLAAPAPWAPSVASPAPLAAAPPVTTASAPPAAAPAPSTPAAAAPVAAPAEAPAPALAAVNTEAKEKPVAKKSKRKAKAPAKQKLDDDERTSVARGDSDDDLSNDRAPDRQADRRPERSRRVVDRWTERDYDVDSEGGGRRRVTVIRRGGGGLFENLFGIGGRDRDDDD